VWLRFARTVQPLNGCLAGQVRLDGVPLRDLLGDALARRLVC
jgi:hypothetical protein